MEIYQPAEDSYLLKEVLSKLKNLENKKILDMGSGSGIQTQTLIDAGAKPENITLTDINTKSIKYLKKQFPKSKIIKSNLFGKINKKQKFYLIIFNPPYLPEDKYDNKKDTTGGKNGDEIILRFLKQSKSYLTPKNRIYLLLSSLTPTNQINLLIKKLKYKTKLIKSKKLFFEELFVLELSQ